MFEGVGTGFGSVGTVEGVRTMSGLAGRLIEPWYETPASLYVTLRPAICVHWRLSESSLSRDISALCLSHAVSILSENPPVYDEVFEPGYALRYERRVRS